MTTPPLLVLPSSACIASVIMSIRRVVGTTTSPFTLEDQSFKWPGERWGVDFEMPPITNRRIANEWKAFAVSLGGSWGMFLLGDPSAKKPLGVATGNPVVFGANQTGNNLITNGWTPSTNGLLLKGDYIQLGSGVTARLHMVTNDVNSDVNGRAVLNIEPELRSSPVAGSEVVVNDAKGLFKLSSNDFSWSVSPGPVYRYSFQAVEVL